MKSKQNFEAILARIIASMLDLATLHGVSAKRFSDITYAALLREMMRRGHSVQEIIAFSGSSKNTVQRALKTKLAPMQSDRQGNHLIRFLASWSADEEFPKIISTRHAATPNWDSLCDRYGRDLTPGFIRKSLLKVGCISQQRDEIVLLSDRYIAADFDQEVYDYIGLSVASHIKTISHNLVTEDEERLFERSYWMDEVQPDQKARLRADFHAHAEKMFADLKGAIRKGGYVEQSDSDLAAIGMCVFMWDNTEDE